MDTLQIFRSFLHYGFHFLVPGLIAWFFYRKQWKKVWLILLLTMFVDLDHLLATPIFDATRCSINFHPLHTYYAISIYVVLLFFPKTRILAIGLVLHMFTDAMDCLWI